MKNKGLLRILFRKVKVINKITMIKIYPDVILSKILISTSTKILKHKNLLMTA